MTYFLGYKVCRSICDILYIVWHIAIFTGEVTKIT